jgi:WD40 repeat protein
MPSSDRRTIVSGSNDHVGTISLVYTGHTHVVQAVAFALVAACATISSFAEPAVRLNISSNSIHIRRQQGEGFSQREGAYVATGFRDNTIKLWDARSGQLISTLVCSI